MEQGIELQTSNEAVQLERETAFEREFWLHFPIMLERAMEDPVFWAALRRGLLSVLHADARRGLGGITAVVQRRCEKMR